MAPSREEREYYLDKLLPFQRSDFKQLFEIMQGLPVTIRTLDPPLHEFLPKREDLLLEIQQLKGQPDQADKLKQKQALLARVEELLEFNPMLGHRGCRLGITFPEIYQMQVRAIIQAACELKKENKMTVRPEIMIPLVGMVSELKQLKDLQIPVIEQTMKEQGVSDMALVIVEHPIAGHNLKDIRKKADLAFPDILKAATQWQPKQT